MASGRPMGTCKDMDEPIRRHIENVAARRESETDRLVGRIVHASWPAGLDDRMQPAALNWLRRWYPARIGAAIPACSCTAGRCAICN